MEKNFIRMCDSFTVKGILIYKSKNKQTIVFPHIYQPDIESKKANNREGGNRTHISIYIIQFPNSVQSFSALI